MHVALASEPATATKPNEDFTAVGTQAVVLLDGAGTPAGSQSGCLHGIPWYARTLGGSLLAEISDGDIPLPKGVAHAIEHVRRLHVDTCDLSHPGSPSSTIIAARFDSEHLDYLVLADSTLVIDRHDLEPTIVTDTREAQVGSDLRKPMDALPTGSPEHEEAHRAYVEELRAARNAPGGFWVASSDPQAADEALTGTVALDKVRAIAALSDGASRIVDRFHLASWTDALTVLDTSGPDELLRRTREAERGDPRGRRWPRGKTHDDATVVYARA